MLIPPKNGFPEELEPGSRLLAIVPIYGTKAAGRGLWKKIKRIFTEFGLIENFIFCALYHIFDEDGCIMIIGTHVDDLIWCCKPHANPLIAKIRELLKFGKEEEGYFTLRGKEFAQTVDLEKIVVTCRVTTGKLKSY